MDPETDQERRRAAILVLVALVFMAVLVGSVGPVGYLGPEPTDDLRAGSGELTVELTDQNGEPVSGQTVQIVDPETEEVVFEGSTDEDGELEATLDQGSYEVLVGDETKSVSLGDDAEVDLGIDTSPPEARRFFSGPVSDEPVSGTGAPATSLAGTYRSPAPSSAGRSVLPP
ncbi:hypothetical protein [Haloglomus litoreum]|uniref:hypothetical protein n=1 Tax=Haloglomus litoreum TaxID=3034026 RepID=UPI0023E86327|nr:hypothetical protein [Haloglomus sp. DT116]